MFNPRSGAHCTVLAMLCVAAPVRALDTASELARYGRIVAHSSADNAILFRRVVKKRTGYQLEFALRAPTRSDAPLMVRWSDEFCSDSLRQLLAERRLKAVTGTLLTGGGTPAISASCRQDSK